MGNYEEVPQNNEEAKSDNTSNNEESNNSTQTTESPTGTTLANDSNSGDAPNDTIAKSATALPPDAPTRAVEEPTTNL